MARDDAAPTLVRRVLDHASARPDHPAVVVVRESGDDLPLTYRDLAARARALADHVRAVCEPGDRALLPYTTGHAFVVGLVACLDAGVVPVPVPPPGGHAHQQARVAGIATDCDAAAVLVDAADAPDVAAWAATVTHPGGGGLVVVPVPDEGPPVPVDGAAGDVVGGGTVRPDPLPGDPAFLQYTSGSTSDPKGVVVTHANVAHHHEVFVRELGLTPRDRFCSWLPAYHDFGLVGMLLVPLMLGATTFLMSSSHFLKRPAHWLTLIDRAGVTVTAAPSFGYEHCVRRVRDEQVAGLDLSRLRWALNGAEPIDPRTLERFTERFRHAGFRPTAHGPGYGLAEVTLTVSYPTGAEPLVVEADVDALAARRFEVRPGDATLGPDGTDDDGRGDGPDGALRLVGCGVPRGLEVLLADDAGAPVGAGRVGEIWLRGAAVAAGYWGRPDATRETFGATAADGSGPWLRTGDLGALHDDQLVVTGRIKELLVVGGRNLYPYDLEREVQAVHTGADGRPGAVFETADAPGVIVAVQEFRAPRGNGAAGGASDALAEVDAAVRAMAARLAQVSGAPVGDVVLVRPGQVRRTTSGKIQRGRTRDAFVRGDLDPIHSLRDARARSTSTTTGRPRVHEAPDHAGSPA
ncbi:AMP-binding protein [Cellulosimicrobium terreum]|nr:AMP-binding protein [Cellulosimicrobium terreum]